MSAVMQPISDPTRGMSLVSNVNPDREKTRYLFFAGQVLDPERVFQTEHLREAGGGEEVQTRTLRRTVGGFIPRARLTPMEVWTEGLPAVLIGEGLEAETVHIQGPTTPETLGMTQRPGRLIGSSLSHVKFYPGDDIKSVLRAHNGKGIVEVKALAGTSWYKDEAETEPGVPQTLNRLFFPGAPPPTLRELRERVASAAAENGAATLVTSVASDMLASCDQFERWAQNMLAVEHTLLRQRVSHLHTYTYSPLGRELLRQLEVQPQDNLLEQFSGGINAAQLAEILSKFGGASAVNPALIGQIAGAVVQQMMTQAAPPAGEQSPVMGDFQGGDTDMASGQSEAKTEGKPQLITPTNPPVPRRRQQNTED